VHHQESSSLALKRVETLKRAFQTLSWSSAVFVTPLHEVTNTLSRCARSCTALARIRPTVSFTTISLRLHDPACAGQLVNRLFASFKVETK
jgi:hypothetical protein